jgi:hypothetical protein
LEEDWILDERRVGLTKVETRPETQLMQLRGFSIKKFDMIVCYDTRISFEENRGWIRA